MEDIVISNKNKQWLLIFIVAASIFMFTLDYSMVNISLPNIVRSFNAGINMVSWLPLAYILTVTATLLGFGRLGDLKGFKKVFLSGLAIFVAGTFLCSLAPDMKTLIIFRVFQCLGEAMMSPMGIAMLTAYLPSNMKGMALGVAATAQGAGFCVGPMLGGFINAHAFWRAIFFVNIPLGIAVILLAITALRIKTLKAESSKFDLIGAFVMYVMIATFIFALNSITRLGLGNPVIIGCFATSFVALSVFLAREKSVSYPILDLSLFRNRNFTFANIAAAMALSVYMGVVFLLPFYLEIVRKIEVFHAGLLLMIPALMLVITSPISGRLSDKLGSRMLCSTGMALGAVAFVIISYFDTATPLPLIALGLLFAGLGVGFFLSPNNKLVMVSAPFDKQGVASGVYKILLNIGGAFGITVLPLVMIRSIMAKTGMQHVKLADLQGSPDILAFGFRGAFLFCALVCAASFVFSFLARDERAQ